MSNTVVLNRPRKFKGPKREYLKVDFNGEITNVMLDDAILADWEDITGITCGEVKYSQRAATRADVDEKKAAEIGELISEDWKRVEVIDYTTMTREEKLAEHSGKMEGIKNKYSLKNVKSLEEATA